LTNKPADHAALRERGPACAGRAAPPAEPGADAGPAAPQAPPWYWFTQDYSAARCA